MSLEKTHPKEVKQILSKYPPEGKRSAVMPLLFLAQREEGYITKSAMQDIAQILDMTETEVASIVGFYTLYHDTKAGKYRMQVCTVQMNISKNYARTSASRWAKPPRMVSLPSKP